MEISDCCDAPISIHRKKAYCSSCENICKIKQDNSSVSDEPLSLDEILEEDE